MVQIIVDDVRTLFRENKYGENAAITAAMESARDVFEYLAARNDDFYSYSLSTGYKILWVDCILNMQESDAEEYWTKAVKFATGPPTSSQPPTYIHLINVLVEILGLSNARISNFTKRMLNVAFIVSDEDKVISKLGCRNLALVSHINNVFVLNPATALSLKKIVQHQVITKIQWLIYRASPSELGFQYIYSILETVIEHPYQSADKYFISYLAKSFRYLTECDKTTDQSADVIGLLRKALKMLDDCDAFDEFDAADDDEEILPRRCTLFRLGFAFLKPKQSFDFIKMMLKCGCDPNAEIFPGKTFLRYMHDSVPSDIVNLIVHYGGDTKDVPGLEPEEESYKHGSLKCLAAQKIKERGLNYVGNVPIELYDFIEMH